MTKLVSGKTPRKGICNCNFVLMIDLFVLMYLFHYLDVTGEWKFTEVVSVCLTTTYVFLCVSNMYKYLEF